LRSFALFYIIAITYKKKKRIWGWEGVEIPSTFILILFIFVNSLAIAKEGELTIGTIDDIPKLHILRSIPLGEHAHRICHQEQSRTFAICSVKYNQSSPEDSEMHFIHLLDDQTFEFISTYPLDTYEYACSILSCSFSDDNNVYYCVGTACQLPEENEPTKVILTLF
jgi:DNA damage-binding protein 1